MNSKDFSPKDINKTALYVLKTIADGHLETDYVPIDKSLLQQIDLNGLNIALRDDTYLKDDKLSDTEKKRLHNAKQAAVLDFYNDLSRRHPYLFGARNYCELLNASYQDFRGINSVQWLQPQEYSGFYSTLFNIGGVLYGSDAIASLTKKFFEAYFIEQSYTKCDTDNSIKAYSHRLLGWTAFTHRLNDDLTAEIRTNFGYGSATYFFVTLIYKGIKIVPYSRLVHYHYINVVQLMKCTREYYPDNELWETALDFVKEACNGLLDNGADAFVTKLIKRECEELVRRLAEYMRTDTFGLHENLEDGRYVREKEMITEITLKDYCLTIFRGSKVAGALDLVESIRSLDELFPTEGYIATIRRCAEIVLPQLECDLKRLAVYITQQEKLLDERRADRDNSQAHLDEVEPTYERHVNIPEKPESWDVICEEYHKSKKAYDEVDDACNQIARDISQHQHYKDQMEEHRDKIRRYLQD